MEKFYVLAEWDAEACVWYVADTNVPGLATEAPTADKLIEKLRVMVPEMLDLNDVHNGGLPFSFRAEISTAAAGHC